MAGSALVVITRAGRCGHHFDKDCKTCNSAMDWTNGEMDALRDRIAALEAEVGRLQRARDRYREQWENEKRRFAETMTALGETP